MCALLIACAGGAEAGDNGLTFGSGGPGGSSASAGTGDAMTTGAGTNNPSGNNSQSGQDSQSSEDPDSESGFDSTGSTGGEDSEEDPLCEDGDGDGFGDNCQAGEDCNDQDPEVNPGVGEVCDSLDHNCDGDPQAGCECPDDGVGGDCNAPYDLGTLAMGESVLGVVGNVPAEGAIDWYQVSFPAPMRPGEGMPGLRLSINENDAFVFDVVMDQCGAIGMACTSGGTSGGTAIALTDWTFIDDDPGCCTPPMDAMVAWPETVYIRVYRTTPGASCAAYQLEATR